MAYKMAYIVLWTSNTTIAIGVFKTETQARRRLAKYVYEEKYEIFKQLATNVDRKYKVHIATSDDLYKAMFETQMNSDERDGVNSHIRDYLYDIINSSILEVAMGTLFDFRDFERWDENNLYDLLDMVLRGEYSD